MQDYKPIMMIKRIVSSRVYETRPWFQIVYEWEDELSKVTGLPVISKPEISASLRMKRLLRYLGYPFFRFGTSLEFIMDGCPIDRRNVRKNTIPWIIDYFLSDFETEQFLESLALVPMVLLSSREAYEKMMTLADSEQINKICHLGLSLPDKWMPKSVEEWSGKDYDLILVGRVSDGFSEYIDRYASENPKIRIAERRIEGGHYNFYSKAEPDVYVGNADTREAYMKLMHRSKAFIYTTPGIDGDKKTNGYSQVTPRFLEALACGCNPVMRYADNADTRWYELSSFSPSIESYEDFSRELKIAINTPANFKKIRNYLSKHLTSKRGEELMEILRLSGGVFCS